MAITLEEAKVGCADKVTEQVIDQFRKDSKLLDKMVFDDAVSPGGNGSTLTYGYVREKIPSMAQFRSINEEYKAQETSREKKTVDLKVFGGSFEIDRVIEGTARTSEVGTQMAAKIKAAASLFHNTVINGDSAADTKAFDGLDVALAGTDSEQNTHSYIDISTSDAMDQNYKKALDMLDEFLTSLGGVPSFLMGNNYLIAKLKGIARRAGYLTQSENAFGQKIDAYDKIPLLDLGYFTSIENSVVKETPVVKLQTRTINSNAITGLTDLYAPIMDINNFHAVTITGNNVIKTYMPNFDTPGAVKKGEVEMIAAVALKRSRGAGVLRNLKVK